MRWLPWREEKRNGMTLDDYAAILNQMIYEGIAYEFNPLGVQQAMNGTPVETIANSLQDYAQRCYQGNGIVFALMAVRQLVFSAVTFQYKNQVTDKLFGTPDLSILEVPWVGATTQNLLAQMIQDADVVGNYYGAPIESEIVRMRPDWVQILLAPRMVRGGIVGYKKAGFAYTEGGLNSGNKTVYFLPGEVIHFAPYQDPMATYRGMSWLTPVIREIQSHSQMTQHKQMFVKNAATPSLVVKAPPEMEKEEFKEFMDKSNKTTRGVRNAYKTLYLAGGADVTVVGKDLKQMDFAAIQGHAETVISAAAGVPPVIAGFSEGLQAATYSNYSQARRRFADGTMHPLWQLAAGALAPIVKQGNGFQLWYDARNIPFLREDAKDAAAIFQIEASSNRTLVDGGYKPDSVIDAIDTKDQTKLVHSGLYSVQLQPVYKTGLPGAQDPLLTAIQKLTAPGPGQMPGNPELIQLLKNKGLIQKQDVANQGQDQKQLPPAPKRDGDGHDVEGCAECIDVFIEDESPLRYSFGRDISQLPFGPGSKLWDYWTHGEGLAKWGGAVHKWTTLNRALKKAGVPLHMVDGLTTNIIDFVYPGYMKLAHHKGEMKGGSAS